MFDISNGSKSDINKVKIGVKTTRYLTAYREGRSGQTFHRQDTTRLVLLEATTIFNDETDQEEPLLIQKNGGTVTGYNDIDLPLEIDPTSRNKVISVIHEIRIECKSVKLKLGVTLVSPRQLVRKAGQKDISDQTWPLVLSK